MNVQGAEEIVADVVLSLLPPLPELAHTLAAPISCFVGLSRVAPFSLFPNAPSDTSSALSLPLFLISSFLVFPSSTNLFVYTLSPRK